MKIITFFLIFISLLNAWQIEANKITVNNTDNDTVTHIEFQKAFETTPLVFTLTDDYGSDPAVLRVVNVTRTGFDIYTIEPQGEDGPHARMTSIPYIAISKGEHTFPDGTKIVADTIDTKVYQSRLLSGSSWDSVNLNGFNTTPVILAEIQTRNNERTDESVPDSVSKPYMTVAIDNVSSSGFNIALERSETTEGEITQTEKVAYLAIDSGLNGGKHYFGSLSGVKIEYETIRTDEIIRGWDDGDTTINFSKSYDDPIVVATKNTRNGGNGGWLRRGSVNSSSITLKVDEDRAYDSERSHRGEAAGILLFSDPFSAEFIDSTAELIINELMYRETISGSDNDEFVELYVKRGGDIKGYAISDQDCNFYIFPSCQVNQGDYIIYHSGTGTDSCSGNIKHFYRNSSQYWNNDDDDVLLLKSSASDVTETTNESSCGKRYFNAIPFDYIAYGNGSAVDDIPTSMKGVTLSWDDSYVNELDDANKGVSIALTPNANDSDQSACWEFSASGNAQDNGCSGYLPTRDTNDNEGQTNSVEKSNTAMPNMNITKSSIIISDPINGSNNPKRVPGAILRYCFVIDNSGEGDAQNVKISDSLSSNNKDTLDYKKSGFIIQDINNDCDCKAITDSSGTISDKDVTIDIGDIKGTSDTSHSRACAYIELEIK